MDTGRQGKGRRRMDSLGLCADSAREIEKEKGHAKGPGNAKAKEPRNRPADGRIWVPGFRKL